MSKEKQTIETAENLSNVEISAEEQAVNSSQEFAKETEKTTASSIQEDINVKTNTEEKTVIVQKSGGKGIAFLALLVAVAVGSAGYYFGTQKLTEVEGKLQTLASISNVNPNEKLELPNFDAEKAQLSELSSNYSKALERITQLEQAQSSAENQVKQLQEQLQKVAGMPQSDAEMWKLSDADFLLNNALRKLVLDNDLDTSRNLLQEADTVLSQISNAQVTNIRSAIKNDLSQLSNVNNVDQNALMQRLTTLANRLDDLPILTNDFTDENAIATGEVSDSIQDWQQNVEKSVNSFLDHFIRISDKNNADAKAFVAPNQEIYLRENIRLRLQIAILAIPRQQNELYKQSLDAVSTWIRSYFDTKNESVKSFLKELDELAEQSVYIDAPNRLQSLELLEQLLNKAPQAVKKIEINAEKALTVPTKTEEQKAEAVMSQEQSQEQAPAQEKPAESAPEANKEATPVASE